STLEADRINRRFLEADNGSLLLAYSIPGSQCTSEQSILLFNKQDRSSPSSASTISGYMASPLAVGAFGTTWSIMVEVAFRAHSSLKYCQTSFCYRLNDRQSQGVFDPFYRLRTRWLSALILARKTSHFSESFQGVRQHIFLSRLTPRETFSRIRELTLGNKENSW
nr:hypothetical protein [Tanacetum cinerariifolium]